MDDSARSKQRSSRGWLPLVFQTLVLVALVVAVLVASRRAGLWPQRTQPKPALNRHDPEQVASAFVLHFCRLKPEEALKLFSTEAGKLVIQHPDLWGLAAQIGRDLDAPGPYPVLESRTLENGTAEVDVQVKHTRWRCLMRRGPGGWQVTGLVYPHGPSRGRKIDFEDRGSLSGGRPIEIEFEAVVRE